MMRRIYYLYCNLWIKSERACGVCWESYYLRFNNDYMIVVISYMIIVRDYMVLIWLYNMLDYGNLYVS